MLSHAGKRLTRCERNQLLTHFGLADRASAPGFLQPASHYRDGNIRMREDLVGAALPRPVSPALPSYVVRRSRRCGRAHRPGIGAAAAAD